MERRERQRKAFKIETNSHPMAVFRSLKHSFSSILDRKIRNSNVRAMDKLNEIEREISVERFDPALTKRAFSISIIDGS